LDVCNDSETFEVDPVGLEERLDPAISGRTEHLCLESNTRAVVDGLDERTAWCSLE
jgi:hypothetical protein